MKSRPTADCSKFSQLLPGRLGRQSYRDVLVVQPVLRLRTNEVVLDQGYERRAVKRRPGRPAPVHADTGTLGRRACTLFSLAHEASADGEAVVWCDHIVLCRFSNFVTTTQQTCYGLVSDKANYLDIDHTLPSDTIMTVDANDRRFNTYFAGRVTSRFTM